MELISKTWLIATFYLIIYGLKLSRSELTATQRSHLVIGILVCYLVEVLLSNSDKYPEVSVLSQYLSILFNLGMCLIVGI